MHDITHELFKHPAWLTVRRMIESTRMAANVETLASQTLASG
jgi:hypothetical protein